MTAGRQHLLAENTSPSPARRHELGARQQRASSSATGGLHTGHEQSITLIMIVVILVFMLCNAPARLVQVNLLYSWLGGSVVEHQSLTGELSLVGTGPTADW